MDDAILLAEHDPAVREMLRRYLARDGLTVRLAGTTDEALAALTGSLLIAVLDLTMPGLDPRWLRQALRTRPAMPAVFLVASGPRPRGLAGTRSPHQPAGHGARRWLTRPFGPRLLTATVRELLRGSETSADGTARTVLVGERPVRLTATEHAFLTAMLAAPGQPRSRAQLRAVTGSDAGDRAVDVHIAQLRAKLGDPAMIRTVRGVGFAVETGFAIEPGVAVACADWPAEGAVAGPLG